MSDSRTFHLSSDCLYRCLSDGSVAIYARDSGDTHFLAGAAGAGRWSGGEAIDAASLRRHLANSAGTADADIESLLRLGILIPADTCA